MTIKKLKWLALCVLTAFTASACTPLPEVGTADVTPTEWKLMLDSSKNTTLNVYHDYTDSSAKAWMESSLVPYMETTLGVKVVLNTLNYNDLLAQLKDEKLNEVGLGKADLIILTKKGFANLKNAGVLYGPFSNKLPNASTNQVAESYENTWFDGTTLENMAVQIGKNQLVLFYDEDKMEVPPATLSELKAYIIANPGKFTFPSLDTSEGQAFVNTLAASLCDQKKLYETTMSPEELKALYGPVSTFLNEIKPYMWMEGKSRPKDVTALDKLFKDGELDFSMSLNQNKVNTMVKEEKFPDGAKAYVLGSGTTGFAQYAVIPFNSTNKSGAMTVLNELLGGEMQGSKYDSKNWGNLPSVDPMKMEKTQADKILKVTVKRTAVKEDELAAARLPQVPSDKAYQLVVYLKGLGY